MVSLTLLPPLLVDSSITLINLFVKEFYFSYGNYLNTLAVQWKAFSGQLIYAEWIIDSFIFSDS